MGFCVQTCALMRRYWIRLKRSPISSLFRIIIWPAFYILQLIAAIVLGTMKNKKGLDEKDKRLLYSLSYGAVARKLTSFIPPATQWLMLTMGLFKWNCWYRHRLWSHRMRWKTAKLFEMAYQWWRMAIGVRYRDDIASQSSRSSTTSSMLPSTILPQQQ